jgi:putative transposase
MKCSGKLVVHLLVECGLITAQRRSIAKSLSEYERIYKTRDEAIINAYASGAYSYQEIGNYFRLHFTRVGRIVRQQRNDKS